MLRLNSIYPSSLLFLASFPFLLCLVCCICVYVLSFSLILSLFLSGCVSGWCSTCCQSACTPAARPLIKSEQAKDSRDSTLHCLPVQLCGKVQTEPAFYLFPTGFDRLCNPCLPAPHIFLISHPYRSACSCPSTIPQPTHSIPASSITLCYSFLVRFWFILTSGSTTRTPNLSQVDVSWLELSCRRMCFFET